MIIDAPKKVRFKCSMCALCCGDTEKRRRRILLLETEAQLISEVTSKPIEEFASRIQAHEPYTYEMKKTVDEGKCIFLEEEKCSIYKSRPLICKYYPFQLIPLKDGRHRFSYTKECPGIGRGNELKAAYFEALYEQANAELRKCEAKRHI
jgi:Fe-S-cluster containining protein